MSKRPYVKLAGAAGEPRNTGFKNPDELESVLELPLLSNGHQFSSVTDFETVASWKTAIAAKSIVPLFSVYEVADGSTEDTFFETGNFKRRTEKGKEIFTFEMYISFCAYAALKSYEQSNYKWLFEFNQGGEYMGVYAADGVKVQGRKIQSITVERRRASKDKVPYVIGEIVMADKDDNLGTVLTHSDLGKDDLHGIYDAQINLVSATATTIKFTVTSGCAGGVNVDSFVDGDVVLKDANGAVQSVTWANADANHEYTLTGTGFVNGWTLETNGVVSQTDVAYESIEAVALTGI